MREPARITCGFKAEVARFLVGPTLWSHVEPNRRKCRNCPRPAKKRREDS